MHRCGRWALNAVTLLSLALCAATAALWAASYARPIQIPVPNAAGRYDAGVSRGLVTVEDCSKIDANFKALESNRAAQEAAIDELRLALFHEHDDELARRIGARLRSLDAEKRQLSQPLSWRSKRFLPVGTLAFGLMALPGLIRSRARRRKSRAIAAGLCPGCGYDMRATPAKCPECGRVPEQLAQISN